MNTHPANEIPVLLLTGYLGSGKTTLLNRILTNERGLRFAVIVNDIGEVNIDAELIQKGGVVTQDDETLVALQNGCICCTLKMDLVKQLHELTEQGKFDYIVIEASGICEPAPIAQTICAIPQMMPNMDAEKPVVHPRLDAIVTIVDALRMRDEFRAGHALVRGDLQEDDIENLLIQQIEFCNIVLLNKVDEVSRADVEELQQIIRALQPKAEIIECNYGDVELERIIGTGMFDFDDVATSATWIREIEHRDEDEHDEDDHDHRDHEDHHEDEHHSHSHGHHHHHHHHDHEGGEVEEYGIGTFVYYRREPLDINKFDRFVAQHWPKGVIRCKGMCYFSDEVDQCYLFEQAGKQVQLKHAGQWYATMPADKLEEMKRMDATLRRDWDDRWGDRMQKLVFIGKDMDRQAITTALDECLVRN